VREGQRGAAFGLRQSLDTIGGFAGPLLAIGLREMLNGNFRLVFWLALIPGVISVLVLIFGAHEPPHERKATPAPLKLTDLRTIGRAYEIVVGVGAVLSLARFSEAFLILRAQNLGLPLALAPWSLLS
jgi:hypothetical protein